MPPNRRTKQGKRALQEIEKNKVRKTQGSSFRVEYSTVCSEVNKVKMNKDHNMLIMEPDAQN